MIQKTPRKQSTSQAQEDIPPASTLKTEEDCLSIENKNLIKDQQRS